jgi:hypothetical protein
VVLAVYTGYLQLRRQSWVAHAQVQLRSEQQSRETPRLPSWFTSIVVWDGRQQVSHGESLRLRQASSTFDYVQLITCTTIETESHTDSTEYLLVLVPLVDLC